VPSSETREKTENLWIMSLGALTWRNLEIGFYLEEVPSSGKVGKTENAWKQSWGALILF
jgi:hypothetical protein